jgi:hydrogenase nickel incorporation protein HypA/HybF
MHELSIAESMLQVVEDAARRNAASKVAAVKIEIGALACVEREALCFCFDAVTRGSIAEGARFDIVETPGAAWCNQCERQVPLAALGEPCPLCSGFQLKVVQGNELRVREIEVT